MGKTIISIEKLGFPWATSDPFLFCAHHNDDYPEGNGQLGPVEPLLGRHLGNDFSRRDGWSMYHGTKIPGFPQHPHRGFETITLARGGVVDHSDSLGATARFGGGDVQWMTAGKGVVHSEMFPLLHEDQPNPLEIFQIWLNLPQQNKYADPYFSMFWRETIPQLELKDESGGDVRITIIAGQLDEKQAPAPPPDSWASSPDANVAIWTIRLEPGSRWRLPGALAGTRRTLYFHEGSDLSVDGDPIPDYSAIQLNPESEVELKAGGTAACELLMLQGNPIGEPVVHYGPFVVNSRAELEQTLDDYRRTQFGGWPWPSDAPAHPKDSGRFAIHADGRKEIPSTD